jgi:AcrR family transcriptional regulator
MNKEKYHHKDLKNQLIKEGSILLAKVGYNDFSLRQVAKTLGVSHAAPYRHFKNKEELVITIVEKGLDKFYDYLYSSIIKYPDAPLNQLREMGKQYILFSVRNADLVKIIFFNRENKDLAKKVRSKNSYQLLVNVINECKDKKLIKTSNAEMTSLLIWGEVHGLSCLLMENNIPFKGKLEDFVDQLIDGIFELLLK